jgi:hypothetical protein
MHGTACAASITTRLSLERYALSAESSRTVNPRSTDDRRSGASMTTSPTVLSVASTDAITFVTVPTCACSLIQRWHFFSPPYFSSNHRAYVLVAKPVESVANEATGGAGRGQPR